jgi:hypothetical protein
MKCFCAIVVLLAILFSAPTMAAGTIGTGTFSCEKFSKYDHAPNSSGQMDLVVQWAWGFISAYNIRAAFSSTFQEEEAPNPVIPPDAASLLLFIRDHCEKNPLSNVTNATLSLIGSLGGTVTSAVNLPKK